MKALDLIDSWIFQAYDRCAPSLPFYRILFAVYLLVIYLPRFSWVGDMPDSFFRPPPGLPMLFLGFPPWWVCWLLDFLLVLGSLLLLVGWHTRYVTFGLVFGLLIGNSLRYSIGAKVDHDILIPLALFSMGFSEWGRRYSRDELRLPRTERCSSTSWPVTLLAMLMGLCMFSAAYPKALSGWVSPSLQAVHGWIISANLAYPVHPPIANLMLSVRSPLFWKIADWSTLAIEGGFIFCIFSLPAMRLIVTLAVFFHAMIRFTMGILFSANLIAYASLLDTRIILRNSWVRHAFIRFHGITHHIGFLPLVLIAIAITAIGDVNFYYGANYSAFGDVLILAIVLFIAIPSLLHFCGAFVDRFIFKINFPLRFDHSLVILYDGECGLCDRWVQFVLDHDRRGIFRFAPLQSSTGQQLLHNAGGAQSDLSTMVFLIDKRAYLRSTAALMIFRQLGGLWAWGGIFGIVPTFIRDFVYTIIAANRHRWFPKTGETCRLSQPFERERFL